MMTSQTSANLIDFDDNHQTPISATEARQRVEAIERDASGLLRTLREVSESLNERTSQSADLANGHVSVSEELSGLGVQATEQLQQSWDKFLSAIDNLGQHFQVVDALAEKTALVRQRVIQLQQQVDRL